MVIHINPLNCRYPLASESYDNQKKQNSNFRQWLQERIEQAKPRRKLTAEETKLLNK